jgi:AMP nucleosidase
MINIGTGPSNARNITDHVAVLRPHAWLMLGHCAGLGHSQKLGDYVLAHGYLREDHVLDEGLPLWAPIPALAEVQGKRRSSPMAVEMGERLAIFCDKALQAFGAKLRKRLVRNSDA